MYKFLSTISNKSVLNFIEIIINFFYKPIQYLIYTKEKRLFTRKKYYFSVCAIFKDEAPYLKEWIEYYKVIGTDHIYLYNNNSTDDYFEVLRSYIDEKYVTLIDFPEEHAQFKAYEDCYTKYSNESNWLAFFDLDEFLCPVRTKTIKEYLEKYEGTQGILVYWKLFGTNGLLEPVRDKLVIEQFTCASEHLDGTGKVIISTNHKYKYTRMYHHFIVFNYNLLGINIKLPIMTEHKRLIFFPKRYNSPIKNTIQLNHYFTKSFSEYKNKISKGDVVSIENALFRKRSEFFYNHEMLCTTEDKIIFRFIIKLKQRMLD